MSNGKIAVVGGGVIGCISAIEIKKKGFDVTVFDQSTIGNGSSWASGGILFPLMPWDYLKKVYDLCKSSAHYYEQLSRDLIHKTGIDPQIQESGLTIIDPLNIDEIENEDLKSKNEKNDKNSTEYKKNKPKNTKNYQKYENSNKIVGLGEHTPGFLSQSFSDRLAS